MSARNCHLTESLTYIAVCEEYYRTLPASSQDYFLGGYVSLHASALLSKFSFPTHTAIALPTSREGKAT